MPADPSEPFLLWHEAAVSGQWRRLLSASATKDVIWALWLLQSYPLRTIPREDVVDRAREDVVDRAKKVIADGWGR